MPSSSDSKVNSIAVIGNYEPRKCGIASFTTDLIKALLDEAKDCRCKAIVINDKPEGYDYPDKVRFEINQNDIEDYYTAARFLNINEVDIVCLQHEFGIFGGAAGNYILKLLQKLRMPVITTLHTVLDNPSPENKSVMMGLAKLSDKLVVMSQTAVNILQTIYDIPRDQIVYIPHGIPDMPFVDPNYYKDHFELLGKNVLLTFGLLSKNKGIEYVIQGLPKVIERFPDTRYIVLGATHPHVLEYEGEKYRMSLQQLVEDLNLEQHVIFKNQFVPFEKLCEYLAATDLYITPYINENQITSGTLAYAMGTGKAVISTPYWHAEEMLSDGRGQLVPFKNDKKMADAIIDLLENDAKRHQMRKRAYDYNRNATWKQVARQYLETFKEVRQEHNQRPHPLPFSRSFNHKKVNDYPENLPEIKLNHLYSLTDDTGLLQHATYKIPNFNHGYCTDDNARALIVTARAWGILSHDFPHIKTLFDRYLAFVLHAFNSNFSRFRNFMGYSRDWLEEIGSEDSHARAIWGLGTVVSLANEDLHLSPTSTLFIQALETTELFQSPRALAFTILGIDAYLETFPGDSKAYRHGILLSEKLFTDFTNNASSDWPWPEDILAYANAKLPHALLLSGRLTQNDKMIQMGLESLDWLLRVQTVNGHLAPVGNQNWFKRGGKKARFDQQPLEANALTEACIAAWHITGEEYWIERAMTCFNWFLGHNDLNVPLYDAVSGGCHDGLQSNGINKNEGAESTLAWLLSLTSVHELSNKKILQSIAPKVSLINN